MVYHYLVAVKLKIKTRFGRGKSDREWKRKGKEEIKAREPGK